MLNTLADKTGPTLRCTVCVSLVTTRIKFCSSFFFSRSVSSDEESYRTISDCMVGNARTIASAAGSAHPSIVINAPHQISEHDFVFPREGAAPASRVCCDANKPPPSFPTPRPREPPAAAASRAKLAAGVIVVPLLCARISRNPISFSYGRLASATETNLKWLIASGRLVTFVTRIPRSSTDNRAIALSTFFRENPFTPTARNSRRSRVEQCCRKPSMTNPKVWLGSSLRAF
mmetsp:Transcript_8331/g.31144  ORF Transcript_8331/g.31144 Transcript_8331/m.31144 type:complete len:232 (+) Transcript_8331:1167-1862(+)